MKRHPALEPFSRDHNTGLILARALIEARPGVETQFREAWARELADHFAEEEELLGPLCSEAALAQLRAEHARIAELGARLPESATELGNVLEAHIRWEERVLFVEIESNHDGTALSDLMERTIEMERRRWPHDGHRERLVRRRWSL